MGSWGTLRATNTHLSVWQRRECPWVSCGGKVCQLWRLKLHQECETSSAAFPCPLITTCPFATLNISQLQMCLQC